MKELIVVQIMDLVKIVFFGLIVFSLLFIIIVNLIIMNKKNNTIYGLVEKIFNNYEDSDYIEKNKYFTKAMEYNLIEKVKVEKTRYKLTEDGIKFLFQSYNENNSLLEKSMIFISILIAILTLILTIANIFLQSAAILK